MSDPADDESTALLDAIDVPILVVGRDLMLVRFNRGAQETLELAPSDLGRRLGTIEALAGIADVEMVCARVIADGAPARCDVRRGDRQFLMRASAYAARGSPIGGALLTFTNVTALRASLERAIYEREFTKTILNTVTTPLVVLDAKLCLQSANRAFYEMFAISRDAAQGVPLPTLGDDAWKSSPIWTSLQGTFDDDPLQLLEIEREVPDLGRRTLLLDARRMAGDGNDLLLLSLQDVTSQKRAAEELRDADRRKDEFLAMLGHELRNPLAPISTALKLMELKGDQTSRREREVIGRQVSHLSRLVDDLLDVARVAQGKIEMKRQAVDIAEVCAKAVEMASPLFENSAHRLDLEMPRDELFVDGDPIRLAQVVGNILTNAAKYTPPRGRVLLSAVREGGEVVVRVEDNGVGIAPDILPHVFEMFVQGPRAIDRREGGLGLGLALVKNLVAAHGGSVSALSDGPGRGSKFEVRLPALHEGRPASASFRLQEPMPLPGSRRVLVVDDNIDAADVLAESLQTLGYEVAIAHDGAEALAVQASFRAEVGVLDVGLPVMDGYELAAQMRNLSSAPLRLIALTGYGQDRDRARALQAGFDAHAVKPIEIDALNALIIRHS